MLSEVRCRWQSHFFSLSRARQQQPLVYSCTRLDGCRTALAAVSCRAGHPTPRRPVIPAAPVQELALEEELPALVDELDAYWALCPPAYSKSSLQRALVPADVLGICAKLADDANVLYLSPWREARRGSDLQNVEFPPDSMDVE